MAVELPQQYVPGRQEIAPVSIGPFERLLGCGGAQMGVALPGGGAATCVVAVSELRDIESGGATRCDGLQSLRENSKNRTNIRWFRKFDVILQALVNPYIEVRL